MLVATGMSYPVGRSNNKAGPPPGDLLARSVTAQISKSGLTASRTRASAPRASTAAMNSFRSRCIEILVSGSPRGYTPFSI